MNIPLPHRLETARPFLLPLFPELGREDDKHTENLRRPTSIITAHIHLHTSGRELHDMVGPMLRPK